MGDTEQNTPETETPKDTATTPEQQAQETQNDTVEETVEVSPLEQAQTEIASLKEDNIRLIAEMENVRKRTQKELQDSRKYAVSPLAKDLFSVSDNLGRALDAVTDEQKDNADDGIKNLIIGLEMVASEFTSAFEKNGIKTITPNSGDKFDVATMQAMQEIETPDVEKGCVVQTLQSAYILNERLLRPAMVIIAK